jgi:hypothetical protein
MTEPIAQRDWKYMRTIHSDEPIFWFFDLQNPFFVLRQPV